MAVFRNTMARGLSVENSIKEYFSRLYEESQDPWDFQSSSYEAAKYEASLRALPREKYENALEIGCSIGVFTAKLASRCARLLAVDISERAVENARERCRAFSNVHFEVTSLPETYPDDLFDLTVLSEVGYYLTPAALSKLANEISMHAVSRGHLLLVHWLAPVPGFELRGDDVHAHFLARPEWSPTASSRTDRYRIDVLERVSGPARTL